VKFPPVQHEPTVGEPSNSVSPGVPKESDWRFGRKCLEQNVPKVRKTKFNRCRRPSEWQTAPNSGTWREGNKGLCSLLQQKSEWRQERKVFLLGHVSKEARTKPQQVF
jgi:hypothetical protein